MSYTWSDILWSRICAHCRCNQTAKYRGLQCPFCTTCLERLPVGVLQHLVRAPNNRWFVRWWCLAMMRLAEDDKRLNRHGAAHAHR